MAKRELDALCIDFIEEMRKEYGTDCGVANEDELRDFGTWIEGVMKFRDFILERDHTYIQAEGKEV